MRDSSPSHENQSPSRPKTTTVVARRMIGNALQIKMQPTAQERRMKEERRLKKEQAKDYWENDA
jgi:hypothetical protein